MRARQPAAPEPTAGITPRSAGPAWRQVALALLLLAGLSLAVVSLADQWGEVREGARELSLPLVAAAGLAVILSLTLSLLSWRSMLVGLGSPVPVAGAARIFFVGQLGKYIPGSVWPVLAQMELGANYGLPRAAVAMTALLTMAAAVPVTLLLGLLTIPALLAADASAYLWLFLVLPGAVVVLSPPVINPLLTLALRLVRRPPLPQRLTAGTVLRVGAYAAGANLLFGLQAWLLAIDLGAAGPEVLPLAIGAFALANVAGLLALPAPAGAGVREAVLVASLSPVLPLGQALVLALVSRVLLTLGDVFVAGAALRFRRQRPGQGLFGHGATGGDVGRPME